MSGEVVIVTGSSGRIGANVVRKLGKNYRIVGFELLKALYASANEELVPVDLSSDESVYQAFTHIRHFYGTKIASVIHLAAYYSFSEKDSEKYNQITVQGTERLLRALQGFEVGQFLFSSTMLVHKPCRLGEKITEESPLQPTWGYPMSKVKTERLIHELRGHIPTVIMRIAGVYDDRCHSIPISHQIQRIYEHQLEGHLFSGNASHGASFVHMQDLVDAICLAVDKRASLPQELTLLIGEPKTLSYDAMQRRISQLIQHEDWNTYTVPKWFAKLGAWAECHIPWRKKPFIRPWMIDIADDNYTLDISQAQQYLGWAPKHSIEETLPKMIEALKADPANWYKEHQLSG